MPLLTLNVLAYRTDEGKPWVLPVVRETEKKLVDDDTLNHEYLPVLGLEACSSAATRLLLGADSSALAQGRVCLIYCSMLLDQGECNCMILLLMYGCKYSSPFRYVYRCVCKCLSPRKVITGPLSEQMCVCYLVISLSC